MKEYVVHHQQKSEESLFAEMTQNTITFCADIATRIACFAVNPHLVFFVCFKIRNEHHTGAIFHVFSSHSRHNERRGGGFLCVWKSGQGTHAASGYTSVPSFSM